MFWRCWYIGGNEKTYDGNDKLFTKLKVRFFLFFLLFYLTLKEIENVKGKEKSVNYWTNMITRKKKRLRWWSLTTSQTQYRNRRKFIIWEKYVSSRMKKKSWILQVISLRDLKTEKRRNSFSFRKRFLWKILKINFRLWKEMNVEC